MVKPKKKRNSYVGSKTSKDGGAAIFKWLEQKNIVLSGDSP